MEQSGRQPLPVNAEFCLIHTTVSDGSVDCRSNQRCFFFFFCTLWSIVFFDCWGKKEESHKLGDEMVSF